MGRRIIIAAVIALTCAAAAFAFDPDELNKITFVNSTGKTIQTIFLSPSDSDEWGPDIMGADRELPNGKSISFYVHYPEATFNFDILAMDVDGNAFELYDYKFTDGKTATITFTRKNLKAAGVDFTYLTLYVENATDYEIDYLFISPADSDAWGVDLLDEDHVLGPGESASFIIPIEDTPVEFNVMGVDEDMEEYQFDLTLDPEEGEEQEVAIENEDLMED